MTVNSEFKLGEHEARLDTMAADISVVKTDIKSILRILDERRGERKVVLWVSSTASAFVGAGLALLARHAGVK